MTFSRRNFIKRVYVSSLLYPLGLNAVVADDKNYSFNAKKPQKLQPGDTVALISPSGAIYESEPFEIAKEILETFELKVIMGSHARKRYGHLAGKDEERAEDINEMFRNKSVKAIICLRGGSGAARVIDKLDYQLIANNPKIFVGYSDITAYLLAIYAKTGLITYHGPVATSEWNEFSVDYFKKVLFEGGAPLLQNPDKKEDQLVQIDNRIRTITPGKASGILVGGNLSVLAGLIGSGYLPDWKGKILFLEEISEKIYAIDRMMSQLKLAGILDQLNGFVMGKCTRCESGSRYGSLTLEEVLDHYIKPLKFPAFSGSMIGHISKKFTVPIGVEAEIDAGKGTIQLLEPAVK